MIALDTNILVYARREETSHHARAREILKQLAEGEQPWALPWPCIYEFIRVVTHPRVFDPPTDLESALRRPGFVAPITPSEDAGGVQTHSPYDNAGSI